MGHFTRVTCIAHEGVYNGSLQITTCILRLAKSNVECTFMERSFFDHLPDDVLLHLARVLCHSSHSGRRAALNTAVYKVVYHPNGPFRCVAKQISTRLTLSFQDGFEPNCGVWLRYSNDPDVCELVLRNFGAAFETLRISDFPPRAKTNDALRILHSVASWCPNVRRLHVEGDGDATFWRQMLQILVCSFGWRLEEFQVDAADFSIPFCPTVARTIEQRCSGRLKRIAILNAYRLDTIPWCALGESLKEISLSATQPIDWAPHFTQIRVHCKQVHTIELDIGRCGLVTELLCSFGAQLRRASLLCPPASECRRINENCSNVQLSVRAVWFDIPSIVAFGDKVRHLRIAVGQDFDATMFADAFDVCGNAVETVEVDAPYFGDRVVEAMFRTFKSRLKSLVVRARKVDFGHQHFRAIAKSCHSLSTLCITARSIEGVDGFSSRQNSCLEHVQLKETGVRLTESATIAACSTLRCFHNMPSLRLLRIGFYACGDYVSSMIEDAMLPLRKFGTCVFVCGTSGVIKNVGSRF